MRLHPVLPASGHDRDRGEPWPGRALGGGYERAGHGPAEEPAPEGVRLAVVHETAALVDESGVGERVGLTVRRAAVVERGDAGERALGECHRETGRAAWGEGGCAHGWN